jgi:hypothetical protein
MRLQLTTRASLGATSTRAASPARAAKPEACPASRRQTGLAPSHSSNRSPAAPAAAELVLEVTDVGLETERLTRNQWPGISPAQAGDQLLVQLSLLLHITDPWAACRVRTVGTALRLVPLLPGGRLVPE